jgi:hypothetical protein
MAAHPHLSSRLLAWKNAYLHRRGRTFTVAALVIVGIGVVAVLPPTGPILAWLGQNWAVAFVIAASTFTLSTARRRQRASIAAATSWLAPLPVRVPVRMPIVLVAVAWLGALIVFAALERAIGAIGRAEFWQLTFALAAGTLVGLLGGWRLPRTGIGAPGFHYAVVRRARTRWASAPSLSPLANWPAAQGRIFSRPRKTAPIVLLAMLAMPMGSPGQVAIAVAGVCLALFSVLTLSVAAVRVAFGAARWLAPTTVRRSRFIAALIWRAVLIQTLTLAVLIILGATLNTSRTVTVAVPLAVLYLGVSLVVVAVSAYGACVRAGLGASVRGA